jgi:hypothetical protein
MSRTSMRCGGIVLALAFLVGGLVLVNRNQTAIGNEVAKEAQPAKMMAAGGPHYTVLETEGTNLVVTDNAANTLYFYTVDKGKAPGSDLVLRAKVDLTQVGKETIKPVDVNIQK